MKTVLVVDDEPVIREVAADALRDEGWTVLTAKDGRAALEVLDHNRVDLVVMDVMMPILDGPKTYATMRDREDFRRIPVVFMSAAIGREKLDPTIAGHLAKPFDLDDLIGVVEGIVGRPA